MTERILAAEPDNSKARDRPAMLYLDLMIVSPLRGDYQTAIKEFETLNKVRENYRQSLELWHELKNQGILRIADVLQPEELSRKLSELGERQ